MLLLAVTVLLVRKHSHSKQTTGELDETPDAIGMKENEANTHIADNVAYMPAAENTVNTDTKEQVNM